jgi:uncharacterized membrane protein
MNALHLLILICAIGCGLIAGVFFAFSVSVMIALRRISAPCGIAAMQAINVAIINPLFLGVFLGTAITSAMALIASFVVHDSLRTYEVLGALLYLIGSFFVTIRFNVPRNNVLASLNPAEQQAAAPWQEYLHSWTRWNHVRTVASLGAAVAFTLAAFAT